MVEVLAELPQILRDQRRVVGARPDVESVNAFRERPTLGGIPFPLATDLRSPVHQDLAVNLRKTGLHLLGQVSAQVGHSKVEVSQQLHLVQELLGTFRRRTDEQSRCVFSKRPPTTAPSRHLG